MSERVLHEWTDSESIIRKEGQEAVTAKRIAAALNLYEAVKRGEL